MPPWSSCLSGVLAQGKNEEGTKETCSNHLMLISQVAGHCVPGLVIYRAVSGYAAHGSLKGSSASGFSGKCTKAECGNKWSLVSVIA